MMSRWEPALTGLVRDRGGVLVRYAALLCGDRGDAEDLVQDALVQVFTAMRRQTASSADVAVFEQAEAYVRRTILNLYLDGYRRRRRWRAVRHLVGREDSTAGPEVTSPLRVDLEQALSGLPPRQRACVILRFYADLSVQQIADELGITTGTVKRHLHDANTHLGSRLAPSMGGEPS